MWYKFTQVGVDHFSSVLWPIGSLRWHVGRFSRDLHPPFLQDALVSSSGMGRNVHSLMLSIHHFLCRPWRRPPFEAPWRAVLERLSWHVTCPNTMQASVSWQLPGKVTVDSQGSWPCSALSRRSYALRGRCGDVSLCTWFRMDPCFRVSKQGPCFTVVEEDGHDRRLVELELACKVDGGALPDPV